MAEGKPNVTVIEHKDFNEYGPELLEKLKGADGCIWAQGISQTQVSKERVFPIHAMLEVTNEPDKAMTMLTLENKKGVC